MAQRKKNSKSTLSIEKLKHLLIYNSETGVFTRRIGVQGYGAGSIAGCAVQGRCISITIDGIIYKAHRLAWFYVTGSMPVNDIDHRDLNEHNNKFMNLRPATRSQNLANTKPRPHTSRFKGVSWENWTRRWRAKIKVSGKTICLGRYDTEESAASAYQSAATKHFGEFARFSG